MSGAGHSTAMHFLEDMGFYCVDNLPVSLIDKMAEILNSANEFEKIAIGIDARSGENLDQMPHILELLQEKSIPYEILFLDAINGVLVKRYKETRRSHPLAGTARVDIGIEKERQKMQFLKSKANYIIDTSRLLTRELKTELERIFIENQDYKNLYVTILSFGFKNGIPADSDIVMDVRFLPNPYYIEELRPKTGNDKAIQDYVLQFPESIDFLNRFEDMIEFLIPYYIGEGKTQLVIAIGCTGGKHRSVTMANEIYKRLDGKNGGYGLKLEHRDIGKDAQLGK